MRLVIVGPGRAGGAIAIAATRAGHEIAGVLSRSAGTEWTDLSWDEPLPDADIVLIAVRDDAIADVSNRIAPNVGRVGVVAHVSGFTPVVVLHHLQDRGVAVGGFHPLQTLPDAETGADALADSFVSISQTLAWVSRWTLRAPTISSR